MYILRGMIPFLIYGHICKLSCSILNIIITKFGYYDNDPLGYGFTYYSFLFLIIFLQTVDSKMMYFNISLKHTKEEL